MQDLPHIIERYKQLLEGFEKAALVSSQEYEMTECAEASLPERRSEWLSCNSEPPENLAAPLKEKIEVTGTKESSGFKSTADVSNLLSAKKRRRKALKTGFRSVDGHWKS